RLHASRAAPPRTPIRSSPAAAASDEDISLAQSRLCSCEAVRRADGTDPGLAEGAAGHVRPAAAPVAGAAGLVPSCLRRLHGAIGSPGTLVAWSERTGRPRLGRAVDARRRGRTLPQRLVRLDLVTSLCYNTPTPARCAPEPDFGERG